MRTVYLEKINNINVKSDLTARCVDGDYDTYKAVFFAWILYPQFFLWVVLDHPEQQRKIDNDAAPQIPQRLWLKQLKPQTIKVFGGPL